MALPANGRKPLPEFRLHVRRLVETLMEYSGAEQPPKWVSIKTAKGKQVKSLFGADTVSEIDDLFIGSILH